MGSRAGVLLVCAMVCMSGMALAQGPLPALITVNGEATVNVVPDEVVLNFGVQSLKPSADEAKRDLDAKIQRILNFVKTQGIDQKNFQTSYLQLYHNYYGEHEGPERRRGEYVARQTITMTLKDISSYEKIISGLVREGVNQIEGIFFQTSELAKYREQARTLALQSARQKAEKMARDLGQSIGAAYAVEEEGAVSPMYREMNMRMNMVREGTTDVTVPAENDPTIAAGQIPVKARIRVSFYLK